VVYWASIEKASSTKYQEQLEKEIIRARNKEDFSAFDIYAAIPEKKKAVKVVYTSNEERLGISNLADLYANAQKQILIFSGNLSFINFKDKKRDMMSVLEELVKRKISIKMLCRVDIIGRENVEKLLSLNFRHGSQQIEIRHREQPLRASIVDQKLIHMKEIKEPTGKIHELDKRIFIFYTLKHKQWTEWLTKIFWKLFSSSIDADIRLKELNKLIEKV